MSVITPRDLYEWCRIPYQELEEHPQRKVPFRLCQGSLEMGEIMAWELAEEIEIHNRGEATIRAIIPCGPACWYKPFTDLVNRKKVSLKRLQVFHMDECLDWQGRELPGIIPTISVVLWKITFMGRSILIWQSLRRTATG